MYHAARARGQVLYHAVSDNSAAITAVSGSQAAYTTNLAYDALNRPLTVSWDPAPVQATPTAATVSMAHSYDASNRRIGQAISDTNWWTPPSVGSITNYSANNLNQYTALATVHPSAGTVNPTHDNNGNLAFDGVFTYGYDTENRLTQISNGGTVATYQSDAQGRRKSKTVGSTTTNYITDGDNRVALEYDGTTGTVQRWYVYGAGGNDVLNRLDVAAATRATLIPDIQGSFIGRLDATTASLSTSGYLPFGGNSTDTASGFRYTAQQLDPETVGSTSQPGGLYYYRARTYAPDWGRFLQPDPIGYADGGISMLMWATIR
ncbi:MAG: RHS repeat-associated core domain-containing protein [Proteobacteria bacterium]|nr:RHS repeat-associated core domain-containing protein [Pseudomonadota bacterium]